MIPTAKPIDGHKNMDTQPVGQDTSVNLPKEVIDKRSIANSKLILNFLSTAVIAITALVAWWEYQAANERAAIQRSFEMIEQWEDDGYRAAFSNVSKQIHSLRQEAMDQLDDMPDDEREELALNYVKRALSDTASPNNGDIRLVIYFFNKIALCESQSLCQSELLERYFHHSASRFLQYVAGFIENEKQIDPAYAEDAEHIFSY